MKEYRPETVLKHRGDENIDAFEQFEHGDIVEIEPGKFCMVKGDEENVDPDSQIELMNIKDKGVISWD